MKLLKIIYRQLKLNQWKNVKKSYSQCGEDLIIKYVLDALNIQTPSYLDIGAYHPTLSSNTYLFYRQGYSGVCIEPDPVLYTEIKKNRKRDICLNIGIGAAIEKYSDFYVMTSKSLNTFSKENAEKNKIFGKQNIENIIKIPLVNVNDIINNYFRDYPNIISLDTEGTELEILKTFNFINCRPEVICVETLSYADQRKLFEIIRYMHENRYMSYADTFINTIFVDVEKWEKRKLDFLLRT